MKNDRAVLKQAIETYGAEAQLNVAIEEFAELTKKSANTNDIWITQNPLLKKWQIAILCLNK